MLDLSIIHIQQQEGTGETTTTNNNEEDAPGQDQQSDLSASNDLNQANPNIDFAQSDMSMIEHSEQNFTDKED